MSRRLWPAAHRDAPASVAARSCVLATVLTPSTLDFVNRSDQPASHGVTYRPVPHGTTRKLYRWPPGGLR